MNAPYQPGRFVGDAHHFTLRIYYEDTDLSGIVYHANYLRYMERARSDMLRLAGIDQRAMIEAGGGAYAVADLSIRYRRPAKLDDTLTVVSRVIDVTAARCVIDQTILCDDVVLTEGHVTAALVLPSGRPTRQPPVWIDRFKAIKQGEVR